MLEEEYPLSKHLLTLDAIMEKEKNSFLEFVRRVKGPYRYRNCYTITSKIIEKLNIGEFEALRKFFISVEIYKVYLDSCLLTHEVILNLGHALQKTEVTTLSIARTT